MFYKKLKLTSINFLVISLCSFFRIYSQNFETSKGIVTTIELNSPGLFSLDPTYSGFNDFNFELLSNRNPKEIFYIKPKKICSHKADSNCSNNNVVNVDYCLHHSDNSKELIDFKKSGIFSHYYKSGSLLIYDRKGDSFKVLINGNYYWVTQENFNKYSCSAMLWKEYFGSFQAGIQVTCNLNLRSGVGIKSPKIALIQKNESWNDAKTYSVITLKGKAIGNWIEVEVRRWKNYDAYCSSNSPTQVLNGFIKHLDDRGYTNIIDQADFCPPM